jgi:uncharacterized OsmC-like protein
VVKYGVNLDFAVGGLDKDEIKQLKGNGETMRHIKIETVKGIDEEKLIKLIKLVKEKAICKDC